LARRSSTGGLVVESAFRSGGQDTTPRLRNQAIGGAGVRVRGIAPKRLVSMLLAGPSADHQQVPWIVGIDQEFVT
jgi:hypothetical protein